MYWNPNDPGRIVLGSNADLCWIKKKKSIEPFSFKNQFSCQTYLWSKSVQINWASLGGSSEWSDLVDVANEDAGKVELGLRRRDRFDAGDGRRRRKLGPVDHHEEHGHADGGLMQEFVSLSKLLRLKNFDMLIESMYQT